MQGQESVAETLRKSREVLDRSQTSTSFRAPVYGGYYGQQFGYQGHAPGWMGGYGGNRWTPQVKNYGGLLVGDTNGDGVVDGKDVANTLAGFRGYPYPQYGAYPYAGYNPYLVPTVAPVKNVYVAGGQYTGPDYNFKPNSSQVDTFMPCFRSWMTKFQQNDEEVVAKFMQYAVDHKTNQELIDEENAHVNQLFVTHDKNYDGLLNVVEYFNAMVDQNAHWTDKFGGTWEQSQEEQIMWYNALNTLTPTTNGISKKDWSKVYGLWQACGARLAPYAVDLDYVPSQEVMDAVLPSMRKWFAGFAAVEEEVQGKIMQNMQDYETNEEFRAEEDAYMTNLFNECDVDNNGLLNCVEYCNWVKANDARQVEKFGDWPQSSYTEYCDFWLALNTMDTSYTGVSLVDFGKVLNIWKLVGELLQQEQAEAQEEVVEEVVADVQEEAVEEVVADVQEEEVEEVVADVQEEVAEQ